MEEIMKGMIDDIGFLWIERGGEIKQALCPFDIGLVSHHKISPCGDWCALFREPVSHAFAADGKTRITIELCRASHTFLAEDFYDDRKEEFGKDTHGQTYKRVDAEDSADG